jgi:hypothetical protein
MHPAGQGSWMFAPNDGLSGNPILKNRVPYRSWRMEPGQNESIRIRKHPFWNKWLAARPTRQD